MATLAAVVVTLATCAGAAGANDDQSETKRFFTSYLQEFQKEVKTVREFLSRMELFKKTQDYINEHNSHRERSFYLGHNQFSDMLAEEKMAYIGYEAPYAFVEQEPSNISKLPPNFFNEWDWRKKRNVVLPVR